MVELVVHSRFRDKTAQAYGNSLTVTGDPTLRRACGRSLTATITPLFPVMAVAVDAGETFGRHLAGPQRGCTESWSALLHGNYRFADDYETVSGNLGIDTPGKRPRVLRDRG
ncbi:MAG: hypothetical protein AB7F74_09750 [Parvibaculaceae bacterium]